MDVSCSPCEVVLRLGRWSHRVRLDEAVISSAEGATLFGLCEPLSPSRHLPTRVPPPPSRRCQSLTTGARGRWSSRLVPVSSSSLATFKEGLQGAPPARIFARKMSLLSAAQNFLPLRGADRMAPCGAGNLFDGEARGKKVAAKVCSRRIDAARRAAPENQGAVRQRCRHHRCRGVQVGKPKSLSQRR